MNSKHKKYQKKLHCDPCNQIVQTADEEKILEAAGKKGHAISKK